MGNGGSGTPIPSQELIDAITARFNPATPFFPGQPLRDLDSANPLFTPEGLYPVTGVKSLPMDTSMAQGVQILDALIRQKIADGTDLVIVGGSQSATISGMEMRNLLELPPDQQPTGDQLTFLLLGDVSNPNGGLFERFGELSLAGQHLTLPSLGITFSGATPSDRRCRRGVPGRDSRSGCPMCGRRLSTIPTPGRKLATAWQAPLSTCATDREPATPNAWPSTSLSIHRQTWTATRNTSTSCPNCGNSRVTGPAGSGVSTGYIGQPRSSKWPRMRTWPPAGSSDAGHDPKPHTATSPSGSPPQLCSRPGPPRRRALGQHDRQGTPPKSPQTTGSV